MALESLFPKIRNVNFSGNRENKIKSYFIVFRKGLINIIFDAHRKLNAPAKSGLCFY